MPCESGPSYDPRAEIDEVKRVADRLKKEADQATRLLCAFGPLVPKGKRSPELEKWLEKHEEVDRIRDIDEKIAALEALKAKIVSRKR